MAQAQFTWRGDRVVSSHMVPLLRRRMARQGNVVSAQIRDRVARPYPPASGPGQPPRRRTGQLMHSIRPEVRASRWSVSLTIRARARHASYLQRGTRHMSARPFLFLTRAQQVRFLRAMGR